MGAGAPRARSRHSLPPPHPPPLPPRGEGEKSRGINAAPAVVVEGKWLISGGQLAGVYEEALRKVVGEPRS